MNQDTLDIMSTSTLLLNIFITGYILNEYITIGIYLSLNILSMSTLLLDIFITGYISNEYITIGYIYHWIYCQ